MCSPPSVVRVINVDTRDDDAQIRKFVKGLTGKTSVPQVFIEGELVGGCSDVEALHRKGLLIPALQKANAAP